MSSQQLKRSTEKAPHTEPGVAEDQGLSPTSLEASADDDTHQRRQSNIKGKTPTGLGAEPLNIVILGASFGGLSCAHHFLDYTITKLRTTSTAPNYRLIIISPSTHIYWSIGAPRALVGPGLIKHEDAFIPIEPGFHRHRGHQFTIIQGECKTMDKDARTVTVELIGSTAQRRCSQVTKRLSKATSPVSPAESNNPKIQTISYHALIMCTGSSAHSDLLSLHGPHLNTIGALNTFHSKVEGAKSIVVCGGGCSGVETAGQLATFLNYSSHFPVRRQIKNPKKIFLITGSDRCLPLLKPKVGQKAEKMLNNLGVEIKHNIRVTAVKEEFDLTGQSKLELSDDTEMITDLYIPCTGVGPNSQYAPASLRDGRDYILTNGETMRVDAAGPRTYCIGDVASYSHNYVLDVYAAVPVVMHNLLNDLIAHELRLASPYGGNQEKIDALTDEVYVQRHVDSQLCPISRFGGVGILMDKSIPRYMVHRLKGHDYRVCKANNVVVNGGNPYAIKTAMGNKYEAAMSVWNPENVTDVAESIGIASLNREVVEHLARDVEFRLSEVLNEALKFMRHAKRTTLTTQDISQALRLLDVEPLYGYESTRPLRFGEASIGPGQPLFYVEDEEADLEKLINAPLPKVPREISFTGHWLAVEGVQPSIPQNPTPAQGQAEMAARGPSGNSTLAALSGNDNQNVRPPIKHVLSKELQLYFDRVAPAIMDPSNEDYRNAAFASLKTDTGIHQLVPYFVQFVADKVTHNLKSIFTLTSSMQLVAALLENQSLYMAPYVPSIVPSVLTCLIGKHLGSSADKLSTHFALRDFSASLLSSIARRYGPSSSTLKPRIARSCLSAFLDKSKTFGTHYGALLGLTFIAGGTGVRSLILPNLSAYDTVLKTGLEDENAGKKDQAEHVVQAIFRALSTLEEDAVLVGMSATSQNGHPEGEALKERLIESLGEVMGQRVYESGRQGLINAVLEKDLAV
ncbi:DUF1546-domain-containing protein [Hortaea werneckii]|nr:DUF1546-domain-containing protein [Hortaea werneckii]KAI7104152.1 DUF1546-domain-containing protein [Hortaea werneckii]KAI7235069.1 DUF1546-domain-containing protein [Hortaea werneckii]KAI7315413.1 DUF1546-domain-containing protein [Hortaea werneckii]KAI7406562.1 DUF1546-domain-containing protein [Hortaea werneckii]